MATKLALLFGVAALLAVTAASAHKDKVWCAHTVTGSVKLSKDCCTGKYKEIDLPECQPEAAPEPVIAPPVNDCHGIYNGNIEMDASFIDSEFPELWNYCGINGYLYSVGNFFGGPGPNLASLDFSKAKWKFVGGIYVIFSIVPNLVLPPHLEYIANDFIMVLAFTNVDIVFPTSLKTVGDLLAIDLVIGINLDNNGEALKPVTVDFSSVTTAGGVIVAASFVDNVKFAPHMHAIAGPFAVLANPNPVQLPRSIGVVAESFYYINSFDANLILPDMFVVWELFVSDNHVLQSLTIPEGTWLGHALNINGNHALVNVDIDLDLVYGQAVSICGNVRLSETEYEPLFNALSDHDLNWGETIYCTNSNCECHYLGYSDNNWTPSNWCFY